MKKLQSWRVAAFLAATLAAAALFGSAVQAESTIHRVEIRQFKFVPEILEVKPGDRIVFVNLDIVPHTVTAQDESWDSGNMDTKAEWATTVPAAMSGNFYCRYHPSMKGKLGIRVSQSSDLTTSENPIAKVTLK